MSRSQAVKAAPSRALVERYATVRARSLFLAEPLTDADATVQAGPDACPAKWHLAMPTAFFETVVLKAHLPNYRPFDERLLSLFDPFPESAGPRLVRVVPGLVTRPSLERVREWRAHVDAAMVALLSQGPVGPDIEAAVELGCHREERQGELLLVDILHLFSCSPLKPNYREAEPRRMESASVDIPLWIGFPGGIAEIGRADEDGGFAFDAERPRHQVLLRPFELADRPVTNGEWMEFIEDGGYRSPLLWLADGWERILSEKWSHPLHWERRDGIWWTMTLRGMLPVDMSAPVAHLSYFEADAYARWAGRRLPTEAEWERAAEEVPVAGNLYERQALRPRRVDGSQPGLKQVFGDVWEWTSSAFAPYPGFKPSAGAQAGSDARFANNRYVLKGGSCLTPASHIRASYRMAQQPHRRTAMAGLRLARDA